jgi:hypothetical protein
VKSDKRRDGEYNPQQTTARACENLPINGFCRAELLMEDRIRSQIFKPVDSAPEAAGDMVVLAATELIYS